MDQSLDLRKHRLNNTMFVNASARRASSETIQYKLHYTINNQTQLFKQIG